LCKIYELKESSETVLDINSVRDVGGRGGGGGRVRVLHAPCDSA